MKKVASFLEKEALSRLSEGDGDAFGRTAFNRYYYATFLLVRDALRSFRSEWTETPHASVPEILRGTIVKELKKGRRHAEKNEDKPTSSMCYDAIKASEALADLMDKGRRVRVTADYNPEIPIDFTKVGDFKLNAVNVTEARDWPCKSESLILTIKLAWKQINV
jgi:hypothetical protein